MIDTLPIAPSLLVPLASVGLVLLGLLFVGKVPLRYNVRNLLVRWRITALTALAFTLVIGLLTIMLAFVNGMYQLTQASGFPENVIVLSDGTTDELFSNLSYGDSSDPDTLLGSDERGLLHRTPEGQPLCSREVYLVINHAVPAPPGERQRRRFVQIRGIEDANMASWVHRLELVEGQWFSEAGVESIRDSDGQPTRQQAIQAVLGEGVARELGHEQGKESLHAGDLFDLGPRRWVVAGVMRSEGSTFGSEIWAKSQKVGEEFGKANLFTTMVLRTTNARAAERVAKALCVSARVAVSAQTETEYYAKLQETNKQFLVAIIFVAVIMAVGGVFGVMNTMFAAISQRTRDIGVLRILGFARWQVLVSFFLESLVIALAGGLGGCAIGYLANGWTMSSIVSSGTGGAGKFVVLRLIVDADILATGVLATLVMGGLGGLLPSLAAMRLRPLESLR